MPNEPIQKDTSDPNLFFLKPTSYYSKYFLHTVMALFIPILSLFALLMYFRVIPQNLIEFYGMPTIVIILMGSVLLGILFSLSEKLINWKRRIHLAIYPNNQIFIYNKGHTPFEEVQYSRQELVTPNSDGPDYYEGPIVTFHHHSLKNFTIITFTNSVRWMNPDQEVKNQMWSLKYYYPKYHLSKEDWLRLVEKIGLSEMIEKKVESEKLKKLKIHNKKLIKIVFYIILVMILLSVILMLLSFNTNA